MAANNSTSKSLAFKNQEIPELSKTAVEVMPGQLVELIAKNQNAFTQVGTSPFKISSQNAQTATINVNYNGFTPQAQAAFQYAVDIWEGLIESDVTIDVDANFTSLGAGVLGSAGSAYIIRDFSGAPQASTWYPAALGNKLAGTDLVTSSPDITTNFNSNFSNWYFGTDGNTPAGKYDFVSVVLHELGHGLGFSGLMGYNNGQGSWGSSGYPGVYDRFTINGSNQSLINTSLFPNPSTALGNQLTGNNLFFDGSNAVAANGGTNPKLYAPSSWQGGSSYSHLDEATYAAGNPNSLMTPQIGTAEAIHDPGAITVGIFEDMGWTINNQPSLGEISGTKWNDLDGDGVQDSNESGLQGWTIYLDQNQNGRLDSGETSTTTDASGNYSFTNLAADTYHVAEVLQSGWEQTYPGNNSSSIASKAFIPSKETISPAIEYAIERASDLEAIESDELNATTQWVIGLAGDESPDELATSLGANNLGETGLIPNTFIFEFADDVEPAELQKELNVLESVEFSYPLVEQQYQTQSLLKPQFLPNDQLFNDQWHLKNTGQTGGTISADANVEQAWNSVRGTGVVIGIVDDGFQYTHPDLSSQYLPGLSYDFNDNDPNPAPTSADPHGTAVGGVAAGKGNNSIGVSGSAPNASLAGLRLIAGPISDLDIANALTHQKQRIDIYNNSWGPGGLPVLSGIDPLSLAALQDGVTNGRSGLGNIYIFAAGNSRQNNSNVNYNGFANSRYTIAVSAIDHNGVQSSYSEPGAPILVAGYSNGSGVGITTTDLLGSDGYNGTSDNDYTNQFGGTSSAAPLVSGVVALMLEANPNLTWRDVQHILVETAEQNHSSDSNWSTNGAGHLVNHKYGFGAIDALAAVNAANTWTTVEPEVSTTSGEINVNTAIPDNNTTGISNTFTITNDINIEWVEVVFDANHTFRGDLEVVLTSPDGTKSILAETHSDGNDDYSNWVFTSARHWDESSLGDWTLRVSDEANFDTGTWNSWEINLYGTASDTPPVATGTHTVNLSPGETVTGKDFGNRLITGNDSTIGETGTISNLTDTARTINLSRNYENPVVFAQPLSYNGSAPATVRLDNITSSSFTVSVQEPNNEDGSHAGENLSFMVLEAGNWELADGTQLEVGTTQSNQQVAQGWETVNFDAGFDNNPVVMSQIQTSNGADFVRTRQDNISTNGFQVGMEEEEANANTGHANETIGYMAMSGGSGNWSGLDYTAGYTGDNVTDAWKTQNFGAGFSETPQILASLASYDGADPAGIRYRNLNNNQVQFKVEEDTSTDAEMAHTTEDVSFLAIEGSGLLSGSPMNFMGETGTISNLTDTARTINLSRNYQNPVVFAQPLSYNGSAPAAVRLDSITSNSFTVSVQEPNNEDGSHAAENLSYIVLEAGTWELNNGTQLEVGTTDSNQLVANGWETVDFDAGFNTNPVVMSQIQTFNGADFVRTRQDNISTNGFQVGMEEEEANATSGHANETIGYLAMSGGSGNWSGLDYTAGYTGDNVTDAWKTQNFGAGFSQTPQLLASLASYDGADPAGIRYRNLNNNQVQFKVEEDTSTDTEMAHTSEDVSFLAIEGSGLLSASPVNTGSAMGETGTISNLTDTARTINLSRNYQNPVVFAQPLSYNGSAPATVRLDNITSSSFTVSVQEPNNEDGSHAAENLSYIVMEAGNWELADGTKLQVGTTDSNQQVAQGWETVNFDADFDNTPVVMSQIQTANGADFVRTRQDNISTNGFQVGMEEEEANKNTGHANETIGYMAMSGGSGAWSGLKYAAGYTGDNVTDAWKTQNFGTGFSQKPQLLASLASYDGADPAGIRYRNLNNNQVQFKVEEDTSTDAEMAHTTENVSFLAIEGSGVLEAVNIDGIAPSAEDSPVLAGVQTLNATSAADTFILGDATEAYYDNMGIQDYALILNFDSSEDVIQLHGSASDYQLGAAPSEVPQGTGIFLDNNELVGVVSDVSDLALDADYFSFV